jgi:hypothetical protein
MFAEMVIITCAHHILHSRRTQGETDRRTVFIKLSHKTCELECFNIRGRMDFVDSFMSRFSSLSARITGGKSPLGRVQHTVFIKDGS